MVIKANIVIGPQIQINIKDNKINIVEEINMDNKINMGVEINMVVKINMDNNMEIMHNK